MKNSKTVDTSLSRLELLRVLNLVSPALATIDLIPVMTHFWLGEDSVVAFNDKIAISHPLTLRSTDGDPVVGAVPGTLLLNILKSSKAKSLSIDVNDAGITVKAASSRLKLQFLPQDAFRDLFEMPSVPETKSLLSKDPASLKTLSEALRLCLLSVGTDVSQPEHLGVTVVPKDGELHLYSTDDVSLTHVSVKMRGAATKIPRFILSAEFCKAFLDIFKSHKLSTFAVSEDHVLAVSEEGVILFGKLIYTQHTTDFEEVLKQHLPKNLEKQSVPIPTKFSGILERALVVSNADSGGVKVSLSKTGDTTKLVFVAGSQLGEIRDVLTVTAHPSCEASFTPKLLKVGASSYDNMLFTDGAAVFSKNRACYLVSTLGG